MAAVFAKVGGNAVGAGGGGDQPRPHRVGIACATRVADSRDMVDVDAQPEHRGVQLAGQAALLPGLIAGMAASSGGRSSAA